MPRPKKEDKKSVPEKTKATAKRRKDKEEDHDDLEEFQKEPEKKLIIEEKKEGSEKGKICILSYLDETCPGSTNSGTHTFKNLASALEFRQGLIRRLERGEYEDRDDVVSGMPYFNSLSNEHVYDGEVQDGVFKIRIKEVTVEELLEGVDIGTFIV